MQSFYNFAHNALLFQFPLKHHSAVLSKGHSKSMVQKSLGSQRLIKGICEVKLFFKCTKKLFTFLLC